MKNFQDLYTVEDMIIAHDVSSTYDTGLSRIAIKAPNLVCRCYQHLLKEPSSSIDTLIKDLKLEYAIQVWSKAVLVSQDNPGDYTFYYWWLHWVEDESPFKHLEYSNFYRDITVDALNKRFWKILEKVANSGEIKVAEGYRFYNKPDEWHETRIKCEIYLENMQGKKINDVCTYNYDKEPKTYKWDEIKHLFCELTIQQLELTHLKEIQKFNESNKPLIEACDKLDLDAIQIALANGAEINCFDKYGNTPFVHAIDALDFCCIDNEGLGIENQEEASIKTKVSECINILKYLLSKGADINLFGCYITDSPIEKAWQRRSKDVVKFLLENGANPNSNCELMDCISEGRIHWNRSSVMYSIDWLLGEEYGPVERDIEWMLRCSGARLYFWDYIPWENERIGKYVVRIDPSRENKKMFVDNSGWFIGSTTEINVEDEVGNTTKIDISSVRGLEQWLVDYQENESNGDYDWISWKNRGKCLAHEVAKLLPNDVALYYLNDSNDVMYKPHWRDYYTFNHSDGYLRIK